MYLSWKPRKGGMTSWVWARLLERKNLILKGAHWQILSGHRLKPWRNKWISCITNAHPNPITDEVVYKDQVVEKFLDFISNSISKEGKAISLIQIGDSRSPDMLIWTTNKKSRYLIISRYRWLHGLSLGRGTLVWRDLSIRGLTELRSLHLMHG